MNSTTRRIWSDLLALFCQTSATPNMRSFEGLSLTNRQHSFLQTYSAVAG